MAVELVIGRVRKPHGVHGEMKIESISGDLSPLLALRSVLLQKGNERITIEVESVRSAARAVLLRPKGARGPEDVKQWRGWEVVVPRDEATPLESGEFYFADLVGLSVIAAGMPAGTVRAVLEGGPWPLLEVDRGDGSLRLVPFQEHFVGEIDLIGRTLQVLDQEILE